jgi:RimJ/RimL family protein N-acetyltransferase
MRTVDGVGIGDDRIRLTERLRLEPITGPGEVLPGHAADLERLHADPWVAEWYDGAWSAKEAARQAVGFQARWEANGVSKWIAYRRADGSLVGRGGMERMGAGEQVTEKIAALLDDDGVWSADRLELGWSLLSSARGEGLATEIGQAGLDYAFGTLSAPSVIAFTERHNVASRAVMERLGMKYAGEIQTDGLVEGRQGVHPDAPFAVYIATAG